MGDLTGSAAVFDQLKMLAGEWRGTTPGGRRVVANYRLSASGSVLVETWDLGAGGESLTIYHLDGSDLMASHFCPQGNQPRLKLTQAAGTRFDFAFYDATGILPGQGVQRAFWIEIDGDARMTRSETYVQDEQPETETITYERAEAR